MYRDSLGRIAIVDRHQIAHQLPKEQWRLNNLLAARQVVAVLVLYFGFLMSNSIVIGLLCGCFSYLFIKTFPNLRTIGKNHESGV